MTGVLALALQRLALSRGTVLSGVPAGHSGRSGTNGTIGTGGTPSELSASAHRDHRCFVCGQPAPFGFGVRLREEQKGRWFCAAHRPQPAGTA
jgi:hypothetical protein